MWITDRTGFVVRRLIARYHALCDMAASTGLRQPQNTAFLLNKYRICPIDLLNQVSVFVHSICGRGFLGGSCEQDAFSGKGVHDENGYVRFHIGIDCMGCLLCS